MVEKNNKSFLLESSGNVPFEEYYNADDKTLLQYLHKGVLGDKRLRDVDLQLVIQILESRRAQANNWLASGLNKATWAIVFATLALVLVTIYQAWYSSRVPQSSYASSLPDSKTTLSSKAVSGEIELSDRRSEIVAAGDQFSQKLFQWSQLNKDFDRAKIEMKIAEEKLTVLLRSWCKKKDGSQLEDKDISEFIENHGWSELEWNVKIVNNTANGT